MRLMITDSGLGGLSICAGLENTLMDRDQGDGIELLYVNATPDDRLGYNALSTQQERIDLFDAFLKATYARFLPDKIAIACNTLSVIYDQTKFASENLVEVIGMVEAGIKTLEVSLQAKPDQDLIIFATETTTEANTYPESISTKRTRVSAQACPELAHAISIDASGQMCRRLLRGYVKHALQRFPGKPEHVIAFLGCTHYGYQEEIFRSLINEHGSSVSLLNPNDLLIEQLMAQSNGHTAGSVQPLQISLKSRYPIPATEIHSMRTYLNGSAPLTFSALQNHRVIPDLFVRP